MSPLFSDPLAEHNRRLVKPAVCGFKATPQRDGTLLVEDVFQLEPTEAQAIEDEAQARYAEFQNSLIEQLSATPEATALRECRQVLDRQEQARNFYRQAALGLEQNTAPQGMAERFERLPALRAAITALDQQIAAGRERVATFRGQFLAAVPGVLLRARAREMDALRPTLEDRERTTFERCVAARYLVLLETGHLEMSLPQRVLLTLAPALPQPAPLPPPGPHPWAPSVSTGPWGSRPVADAPAAPNGPGAAPATVGEA